MSVLTRDQLFAAQPETATVTVDRLGADVVIRALTRGARKRWMEAAKRQDPNIMEVLILESLVEPALTQADLRALNDVDERVVEEIFAAITQFNGWGVDNQDDERRAILVQVAEGEVSVDDALARFRSI